MYITGGTRTYAQVSIGDSVVGANPHRLTDVLFDDVNSVLMRTHLFMQQGGIVAKGEALSKAVSIIDNSLKAGLDQEIGGEIATNLSSPYDYMIRRLLQANLRDGCQAIEKIEELLGDTAGAWKQILPKASSQESR